MPLEVQDVHLLARAVFSTAEYVDRVVVVLGAMEEATVWHVSQFDKRKVFKIEDHSVFGASAVVVTTKDNNFIAANQGPRLSLN